MIRSGSPTLNQGSTWFSIYNRLAKWLEWGTCQIIIFATESAEFSEREQKETATEKLPSRITRITANRTNREEG